MDEVPRGRGSLREGSQKSEGLVVFADLEGAVGGGHVFDDQTLQGVVGGNVFLKPVVADIAQDVEIVDNN